MKPALRLSIGLPTLLVGAALALAGGIGPAPDWLGWLLLLPGVIFTGSCVRRGVLEPLAITLLVVGGIMTCQPHLIALFRYNTAVLVVAAALFTIASHLADDARETTDAGRRARNAGYASLALGGVLSLQPWWPVLAVPGAIALGLGLGASILGSLLARPREVAA